MVILEAQVSGKVVIASSVGGIPEMIAHGETGFLFPNQDVPALTALIRQCADDAELRMRVGNNAREFVNRERSLQGQADAFTNLITPLLQTR